MLLFFLQKAFCIFLINQFLHAMQNSIFPCNIAVTTLAYHVCVLFFFFFSPSNEIMNTFYPDNDIGIRAKLIKEGDMILNAKKIEQKSRD